MIMILMIILIIIGIVMLVMIEGNDDDGNVDDNDAMQVPKQSWISSPSLNVS